EDDPKNRLPYPTTRRPWRRPLSKASTIVTDEWFSKSQVEISPYEKKIFDDTKRLLYTYRDLNAVEIKDIPATDLFLHGARLKTGVKPHCEKRIIQQSDRMYERVPIKNGKFSDWSAGARVVEKPGNALDMRITFNYHYVYEALPGTYMELISEIHYYLSLPQHQCFIKMDIKHAYWSIPVRECDRHIYAFFIPGIGQLQPTRMPQGCGTSGFSLQELMQIVWGHIPSIPVHLRGDSNHPIQLQFSADGSEPSLLRPQSEFEAAKRDHLLPRIDLAEIRLSSKKLKLYFNSITALGLVHTAGGIIKPKQSREEKIKALPVPLNQSEVRRFLGMIGTMRRFIVNYSEIARPLSRLQGNVPWQWRACEQVSFDLLKEKVSSVTESNEHDPHKGCFLYSDVSSYAAGCCITQKRLVKGSKSKRQQEHPILFDSFIFNHTERKYGTYKRDIFGIVSFCRKYAWMLRTQEQSIIFTDHKPLTHFMDSHLVFGIYSRWADELNLLNVRIEYISGTKNKVADALSRTIFPNEDCSIDNVLSSM
ncbi:hypothetical protein EPUL_005678, partial [Erysiphe pulchra]